MIRETELLPERDNERATEDEIKARKGESERGAYRELREDGERALDFGWRRNKVSLICVCVCVREREAASLIDAVTA